MVLYSCFLYSYIKIPSRTEFSKKTFCLQPCTSITEMLTTTHSFQT